MKKRALLAGGGAVEAELSLRLGQRAKEMGGVDGYCLQRYAEALEVIPYTLAENAALNPIEVVTNLRKMHNGGDKNAGINVRKVKKEINLFYYLDLHTGRLPLRPVTWLPTRPDTWLPIRPITPKFL